jgi:metal-dependent amidase/aminoacylase/carboxypeptidase family protein
MRLHLRPWAIWTVTLLLAAGGAAAADPPGAAVKERAAAVGKRIDAELADLRGLYEHLHANPELSLQEIATAARMAKELKAVGFTVSEKVGGTGVVGVLKNGDGPTILVRTDMDALPVTEQTK